MMLLILDSKNELRQPETFDSYEVSELSSVLLRKKHQRSPMLEKPATTLSP
jgi:hypothetical protein